MRWRCLAIAWHRTGSALGNGPRSPDVPSPMMLRSSGLHMSGCFGRNHLRRGHSRAMLPGESGCRSPEDVRRRFSCGGGASHPHGKGARKRPAHGGGAIFNIVGHSIIHVGGLIRANNVEGGSSRECRPKRHPTANTSLSERLISATVVAGPEGPAYVFLKRAWRRGPTL